MLNWLVEEKGIAPHIPVIDKWAREDGSFSRADFRYDEDEDIYVCPAGKQLRTSGTIVNDEQRLYRGATADCRSCPLKPRCCPREPLRKVPRSIYEAARDVARSLFATEAYARSRRDRQEGRDAVCASEAHPAPRPAAPARPTSGRGTSFCSPPRRRTSASLPSSSSARRPTTEPRASPTRRGRQ